MKLLVIMAAGAIAAGNLMADRISEFSAFMDNQAIVHAIDRNTDAIHNATSSSYPSWSWPRSKKAQQRIDDERKREWDQYLKQLDYESKQREIEKERQETYRKNRDAYYKEQQLKRIDEIQEYNARIFFNAAVADGTIEIRKALPAK